jgi:hypothetical protein
MLRDGEDLVVRLSAAKALKVVIDDFEFSTEELEPYLPLTFERLFILLKEVQECDTKVTKFLSLNLIYSAITDTMTELCSVTR